VKLFHIIITDDDADDQLIIRDAVKEFYRSHVHITTLNNGLELVEYLQKNPETTANAILLDINMPKMDGLEALSRIKNGKHKNIPIYMLSTLRTPERFDTSIKLGAKNFYTKPNDIKGYESVVKEIFEEAL